MSSQPAAAALGDAAPAAHAASATTVAASAVPVRPAAQPCTRLMSIQSSVVYGYVGNKASNFPLQLLGFDVDPIHSCQFSNHTGHATFSGHKTTGEECRKITQGLKDNRFLQQYGLLLTGYMSSAEFLDESVRLIREMKASRPSLVYACDPVLGDNDSLYVPASFVSVYRDSLLPLADIATPNQTEAELLSGIKITDRRSAWENLAWFHARGVRTVIITSMTFAAAAATANGDSMGADDVGVDWIHVMASTVSSPHADPHPRRYAHMRFRRVPTYFSGTGDLTTALLLAWLVRAREAESVGGRAVAVTGEETDAAEAGVFSFDALVRALEATMATLQSVIHRTAQAQSEELLLIQSKGDIEAPIVVQRATVVDADEFAAERRPAGK